MGDEAPVARDGAYAMVLNRSCLCIRGTVLPHVYAVHVGTDGALDVRGDEVLVYGSFVENDVPGGDVGAVDKDFRVIEVG